MKTDEVTFELIFTSMSDPFTDRANIIAYDSGTCKMVVNTTDDRYWTQTSIDQYYKCTEQGCSSADPVVAQETQFDWENHLDDDDDSSPFCTRAASDSDYWCSAIKCAYRRQTETGDVNDFQFSPATSTDNTDRMIIP